MQMKSKTGEVIDETIKLANDAIGQRNIFAAAFVHACDDEGTYFGLEPLYEMAKMVIDEGAEELIRKTCLAERGY
jgi:hypothetical protein